VILYLIVMQVLYQKLYNAFIKVYGFVSTRDGKVKAWSSVLELKARTEFDVF